MLDFSFDGIHYSTDLGSGNSLAITGSAEIDVNMGPNGDTLILDPSLEIALQAATSASLQLVGGAGSNTLTSLAGPSNSANTWNITAANTGVLNNQITFTKVQHLVGGLGVDNFVMGAGMEGSKSSMSIDGGLGGDTLDYSHYTSAVTVDLSAGTATDLSAISNITKIVGGSGNDSITGDSSDDTFTVGSGNDTLTGGGGNNTYIFTANTPMGSDVIQAVADDDGVDTLDFSGTSSAITRRSIEHRPAHDDQRQPGR